MQEKYFDVLKSQMPLQIAALFISFSFAACGTRVVNFRTLGSNRTEGQMQL